MSVERRGEMGDELELSKGSIGLQNHNYHQYHQADVDGSGGGNNVMRRWSNNSIPGGFPNKIMMMKNLNGRPAPDRDSGKRGGGGGGGEYKRSLSQGRKNILSSSTYLISLEGTLFLICLAASLLLLPLILPPLPPPPFMLLLLPICILLLLMILAFMPSSARAPNVTSFANNNNIM